MPELTSIPPSAPADPLPAVASDGSGRSLDELPREELDALAPALGIDATRFAGRQDLAEALIQRRREIAAWDTAALRELLAWGRRTALAQAANEDLAREVSTIHSMKFSGLSHAALLILARMRQADAKDTDDPRTLIRKLKRQEGFVEKFQRKKRAFIGKMVSNILGDDASATAAAPQPAEPNAAPPPQRETFKDEIEEAGLWGGITNRIKRTADQYLNQKLDEIEARIDRKLGEIDRRLGEWRDKEIANRLKILKITLWASVIVAVVSLIYSWLKL